MISNESPPGAAPVVSPNVQVHLADFDKRLQDIDEADRVKHVYHTTTFAARYFDSMGGYLEIEEADVRLYIPPGALENKQLIYINLDPHSQILGEDLGDNLIAPVVQCGPPGLIFKQKVTLSYPHCATDVSQWEFESLICQSADAKASNWKNVKTEDADVSIKKGRTVIKINHFTRFTTKARPRTPEAPASKNMRVGAFGTDYKEGTPSYQFRVRIWKDTKASTQMVREEERGLNGRPIDADRKLVIRNTEKDISIKIDQVKAGWRIRNEDRREQRLPYDEVWKNENPSCTVDLDVKDGPNREMTSKNVYCDVKAQQLESPDREVFLSISPKVVTSTEDQDLSPCTNPSFEEDVFGPNPKIKGLPEKLFYKLVPALNIENDTCKDWRAIMDEMGRGDMTTITNVRKDKNPANVALRHYLMNCRAEGSNNPISDLEDVFEKKCLDEAKKILEEWQNSESREIMDQSDYV